MMLFYLLFVTAFFDLVLGSIVYKNNSRGIQNKLFALFVLFGTFWAIGDAFMLFGKSATTVDIGTRLFLATPVLTTLFVVLFTKVFPLKHKLNRHFVLLITVPTLLFVIVSLVMPDLLIASVKIQNSQNVIYVNHFTYGLYTSYFSLCLGYSCFSLLKSYLKSKGNARSQIAYSLAAIGVSSVVSALTNLSLPLVNVSSFVWAGPISTLFFATAISFSIVRHHLFDVRLVVARSLGYILSLGVLIAGYFTISYAVTSQLISHAGNRASERLLNVVLIFLVALTYSPIKRFFDRQTNRFFYRDSYDPQTFLDQLNGVLVSNIELNILLRHASAVIESNLKSDYCVFVLDKRTDAERRMVGSSNSPQFSSSTIDQIEEDLRKNTQKLVVADELLSHPSHLSKAMYRDNIAVIARLATGSDNQTANVKLGYIVFGAKKSGNPYNKQDIKTLGIITDELLIAIQNSLRFEEIESFAATLQEKVNDATRKLQRTNEKLKQLDETKDEFISMASHQLRTPLTSVKGYVSMVIEGDAGKLNPMQAKLLNQAFVSSQRMVYLIADLLNVSRLRTGKFVIDAAPCNLADVVEGEVSQLIETAKGRNLTLGFHKPAKFPALMLDETKIRQVIMNFTDNAIFYTPAGGHIKLDLIDKKETVEFMVIDDGIGVPPAEQHHMFTKFYRAGNAQKARPDGTGLGLFMAQKVIVAQGGSIIFHSKEGKGSTFGFSFPKNKLLPPVIAPVK